MRSSGRPGRRSEDNIKMYFKEIWLQFVDSMHLAQRRPLVNMALNFRVL